MKNLGVYRNLLSMLVIALVAIQINGRCQFDGVLLECESLCDGEAQFSGVVKITGGLVDGRCWSDVTKVRKFDTSNSINKLWLQFN